MDTPVYAQTLNLAQIRRNPGQPRRQFDPAALVELALSINANGLVQPVVVQIGDGITRLIVDGERRWRASCALAVANHRAPGDAAALHQFIEHAAGDIDKFIDLHRALLDQATIPAVVSEAAADNRLLVRATVANLHRADLNDIELAAAYQTMADGGMSDDDIARAVGKSRPTVANTRRLMRLPDDMRQAVGAGIISQRVALAYLPALDIKPHEIGTGGLDNQPTFAHGDVPTPAALRKRLCNPDKYGRQLTSEDVRRLVDEMKDRCTPAPCVDCGCNTKITEHHKIYTDPGHEIICGECYRKRKEAETHPRWCPNCRHETTLNTLQIEDWKQITCDECGQRFAGYNWRKDPPTDLSKIEYKPLVLEDSPAAPTQTRYCPECGAARELEESRIQKGLRSNCANCHAIYPADEWLAEPLPPAPAPEPEPDYAVYPCHECGEKKIVINPIANDVHCDHCEEFWETISDYHADRTATPEQRYGLKSFCLNCGKTTDKDDLRYSHKFQLFVCPNCLGDEKPEPPAFIILDNPPPAPWEEQPLPATNGNGHQPTAAAQVDMVAKISQRFFIILDKIPPVWLPELDAWLDDVEKELLPQTELS